MVAKSLKRTKSAKFNARRNKYSIGRLLVHQNHHATVRPQWIRWKFKRKVMQNLLKCKISIFDPILNN